MKRPTVHLICNAHLDPVWQWRWEEGCAETLATFRTAVQLLLEHDDLIFNHNEALLYQWVQKYDPPLFREIQQLVKKGRWFISGGWYLQPDVTLPGTESLIRHISVGRRYFQEHFRVQPKVAYNFDSFGHSGGLPQILSLSGYKMYIHMRPHISDLELPSDLYRWRGVDGSEIIGLRIIIGLYHTERDNIEQRISEGVELALKLNRDVPVFWGLGDHGGGATREDLEKIDAFIRKEDQVDIIHSTPDRLYDTLREAAQDAPVVEGDLQRVFTGCYTSLSRIKRRALKSLARLVQVEALRSATWWVQRQEYPEERLDEAWRDHLFNDFHDILPGSCTEPAERDALDFYGRVAETVRRLRLGAAVVFNQGPIQNPYLPVTVLNANPSATRVPVEVECMLDYRPRFTGTWHLRLFTPDGQEVPCQEEQPESLLPFNGWRRKVCFMADLPGLGSASYRLEVFEGTRNAEEAKPALTYQTDPVSGLVNQLDAGGGRECLIGPLLQPLAVKDDGDSWGTDRWSYREVLGRFRLEKNSTHIIQTGPIRTITESVLSYHHSKIVLHTIAYPNWPLLEFRFRIHWNEIHKRLKLSISTAFDNPRLQCEVPGGVISRPADGEEHVHGRWFVLEGKINGKDTALAVINSGQHGLDFADGEVRLSVLRSAAYCHEQGFKLQDVPARKYMDQGIHHVCLLITAGDPDTVWQALPGASDWLSAPPVAYAHLPVGIRGYVSTQGDEEKHGAHIIEVLSLKPGNIRVTACKRSWDSKSLVVRLQETRGISTEAHLKLKFPEIQTKLSFRPFEIKTVRFEKTGKWREVELIHEN